MDMNTLSPHVRWVKRQTSEFLTDGYVDYDHVFTFIAEGGADFIVEGYRHGLSTGDAILLPPFARHVLLPRGDRPFAEFVVHFDPVYQAERAGLTEIGLSASEKPADTVPIHAPARVFRLPKSDQQQVSMRLKEMLRLFGGLEKARSWFLKAVMVEILAICMARGNPADEALPEKAGGWHALHAALDCIQEMYADPDLDNAQVARQAGVTPNHLSAVFRDQLGLTLHRYLTQVRIERARQLLAGHAGSVTEIAQQTGFSSVHAFSRAFHRETGLPPTSYSLSQETP